MQEEKKKGSSRKGGVRFWMGLGGGGSYSRGEGKNKTTNGFLRNARLMTLKYEGLGF